MLPQQMRSRRRDRLVVSFLSLALIALAADCGSTSSKTAASIPARTPTPARDVRLVTYSSMVNSDMGTINNDFYKKLLCKTRDLCVAELQDIRAAANALLQDLTTAPAPQAISQPASNLKAAAQQFIDRIDAALLAMQQPSSDYVRDSGTIDVHSLNIAAAGVVCWPATVIPAEAGESGAGYVCG